MNCPSRLRGFSSIRGNQQRPQCRLRFRRHQQTVPPNIATPKTNTRQPSRLDATCVDRSNLRQTPADCLLRRRPPMFSGTELVCRKTCVMTVHFRPVSRANEFTTLPPVRKCNWLGPMVYRLLFESSAELIRRTDTPTRLATDSGE